MKVKDLPEGYIVHTKPHVEELEVILEELGAADIHIYFPVLFIKEGKRYPEKIWGIKFENVIIAYIEGKFIYDWEDETEISQIYDIEKGLL